MLERHFKKPCTLHRLRGPAGPFLDSFACAGGYSSKTSASYLQAADHLGQWAARRGVAIADLDEDLLARFVHHLPRCRCRGCGPAAGYKRVPFRVRTFLRYLHTAGVVRTSAPAAARSPLLTEYGARLRHRPGLAATTIAHSLRVAQALLDTVNDAPAALDAASVRRFVLEYIRRHAPASAGSVTTPVRGFLRWLITHGRCASGLVDAVPTLPT